MPDIFNALPGLEVPVGAITGSLNEMWTEAAASGAPAPASEDPRATQVNLVLHLGLNTTAEDAAIQFQTAVEFSKRCPSRVVVLCPLGEDDGVPDMRARIYGECHLGKSKSDKRCVEFVILSYTRKVRQFLESEVSICLSTDLPLYYWAHRFTSNAKLADYTAFLTKATRVILDSAIAPDGALDYPWPRPEKLRDLVHARLLPVRQGLGQFLSRYPVDVLGGGLQTVALGHDAEHAAEARVLLGWLRDRLAQCGGTNAAFSLAPLAAGAPGTFALAFAYAGGRKKFAWQGDLARGTALFEADFGSGRTTLPAAVSLLAPEAALNEAMFN
jgi:hypothetical protein